MIRNLVLQPDILPLSPCNNKNFGGVSIMKKVRSVLVSVVIVGALTGVGYIVKPKASEIDEAFCSKLEIDENYEKYGLEHYQNLIKGKDGWIFRTENDFRSDFTINEETTRYLLAAQEAFRQQGTELVMLYPPVRGLIHATHVKDEDLEKYGMTDVDAVWSNYEQTIQNLRSAGVNIVGLSRDDAGDNYFYKRNHHWTADGAKRTAEKIAQTVRQLPVYEQLQREKFRTVGKGADEIESTFEKAFRKMCDTTLPKEEARIFTTIRQYDAVGEEELLGDSTRPEVVLLGTSNSVNETAKANFDGFLKDELKTDLLNLAVVGAGIDTSIMSFINSDEFRNGNVKLAIWEIPGYYDLNVMDDRLFRQIIPAAYGACPENALAKKKFDLEKGRMTLFDFPSGDEIAQKSEQDEKQGAKTEPASFEPASLEGGLPYMHFTFTEPVKKPFRLRFHFTDDDVKLQRFDRDERYPDDRDFYALFPVGKDLSQLSEIAAEFPEKPKAGSMDVEICALPDSSRLEVN
ncbi:MAG: hypothetical protein EOM26_00125 [Alphaproteobacteria bacterium]|nr:hypothetical protein [Alphaproteobacteria bacterium]